VTEVNFILPMALVLLCC